MKIGYLVHDMSPKAGWGRLSSDLISGIKAIGHDVIVMNYPNTEHYAHFMLPLKLFEYMASSVPIVTSDLPSVMEILNKNNFLFVKVGNQ